MPERLKRNSEATDMLPNPDARANPLLPKVLQQSYAFPDPALSLTVDLCGHQHGLYGRSNRGSHRSRWLPQVAGLPW